MSPRKAARALGCLALILATPAVAGPDDFSTGPLIEAYGPVAPVDITMPLPNDATLRVALDVSKGAEEGEHNRAFTTAARFLNMHVANGLTASKLHLAVVIHGTAVNDVTMAEAGANAGLVTALKAHGVRLIVCGQSAAYYGVATEDLLPGVEMALSAMTAHALLQQDGYTLNPF